MSLTESSVEDAALEWFGALGYAVGQGPHLAPGEPAAERYSFGEVVLVGRLRETIRRLNSASAFGNPHPTSPKGRGDEARASHQESLSVRIERTPKP